MLRVVPMHGLTATQHRSLIALWQTLLLPEAGDELTGDMAVADGDAGRPGTVVSGQDEGGSPVLGVAEDDLAVEQEGNNP